LNPAWRGDSVALAAAFAAGGDHHRHRGGLALPAAVLLARRPAARRWVLGFTNIAQTVPSLALFGFLLPFIGIGEHTAIAALSLYALLPILRNTLTGILGVDPGARIGPGDGDDARGRFSGRWNCRWRSLRSWPDCASPP
jgi:hypothetical protein